MANKSIKDYAKEAKQRLKSNFWQDYKDKVNLEVENAQKLGNTPSKVVEYYQIKASESIKGYDVSFEEFYLKVKEILLKYGEVSDIIGRLTDKEYYDTLTYEQKQKYTFSLSERYLKAKNRFYEEIKFEKVNT